MENINSVIAENLKSIRDKRKLSLDALAKLTGVSKSMLGQIERGDVNPTISTVWKITNGLRISFTELMEQPESEYKVLKITDIEPLMEDDGKYRNYPLFTFDADRRFEMYYLEIDAGSFLDAEPHPEGTQEFITVFSGTLKIMVAGDVLTVNTKNSVRFLADCPHRYQSTADEVCRISMVIYYP